MNLETENYRELLRQWESAESRLAEIARIIEGVDNRCMAADGPVTPTRLEISDKKLQAIYKLAKGK